MLYTEWGDEGFEIKEKAVLYFACCDCGLVHEFIFGKFKKGKCLIKLERDNRRTGQFRRHYHKYLSKPGGKNERKR